MGNGIELPYDKKDSKAEEKVKTGHFTPKAAPVALDGDPTDEYNPGDSTAIVSSVEAIGGIAGAENSGVGAKDEINDIAKEKIGSSSEAPLPVASAPPAPHVGSEQIGAVAVPLTPARRSPSAYETRFGRPSRPSSPVSQATHPVSPSSSFISDVIGGISSFFGFRSVDTSLPVPMRPQGPSLSAEGHSTATAVPVPGEPITGASDPSSSLRDTGAASGVLPSGNGFYPPPMDGGFAKATILEQNQTGAVAVSLGAVAVPVPVQEKKEESSNPEPSAPPAPKWEAGAVAVPLGAVAVPVPEPSAPTEEAGAVSVPEFSKKSSNPEPSAPPAPTGQATLESRIDKDPSIIDGFDQDSKNKFNNVLTELKGVFVKNNKGSEGSKMPTSRGRSNTI